MVTPLKAHVTYRVEGRVAVVSLNRPRYRNCMSRHTTYELDQALTRACQDRSVRVIILRGEGEHFCSGHDLGTAEHTADLAARPYEKGPAGDVEKWSELDLEMCARWRNLPKPLLGGAKGFCIYHACAVLSCCDVVLAADDVKMMPSLVEYNTLCWDLGLDARKAKEIAFMQRFVLAAEAKTLGLVNHVVAKADLDDELMRMARIMAKADPFHLRMIKLAANQAQDQAGYAAYARGSLSHWTAYRWSWSENMNSKGAGPGGGGLTRDHGGQAVTLAPIKHALSDDVLSFSRRCAL